MVGAALLELTVEQFGIGQQYLARCTKQLVSTSQSPMAGLLDYSDDSVFLEPSLFAYFGGRHPQVTLEQLLFGHLPDSSRPPGFEAYADDQGQVYLPRLGNLTTDATSAVVNVDSDGLDGRLTALRHIGGTQIELCLQSDPLLETFFRETDGEDVPFDLDVAGQHADVLDEAFEIFRQVSPDLFACLAAVTRRVVVFRSDKLASFANISAHGTAFLNVTATSGATEVFFIEDLAHQGGHVLFNAVTVHRDEFLLADPDTPLQQITGAEDEPRNLYTAFHGVFTEALMCIALQSCLEADVFSEEKQHELLGRLSFVMKRFHLDLLNLNYEGLFTDRGLGVVQECGRIFDDVFRRSRHLITQFDLSNQGYTFSFDRFAELNPVAVPPPD